MLLLLSGGLRLAPISFHHDAPSFSLFLLSNNKISWVGWDGRVDVERRKLHPRTTTTLLSLGVTTIERRLYPLFFSLHIFTTFSPYPFKTLSKGEMRRRDGDFTTITGEYRKKKEKERRNQHSIATQAKRPPSSFVVDQKGGRPGAHAGPMLKETGGCGRRRVVVRRTKKRVKRNPTRRTPLCDLPPQHGTINNTIEFDNRKKKKYKTSTLRQPVTMASFRFITINSVLYTPSHCFLL